MGAMHNNLKTTLTNLATGIKNWANGKFALASHSHFNEIYPVGSVFITSTNTNPNTLLGAGTWTLYDKEFQHYYAEASGSCTNIENCTVSKCYIIRSGHQIQIRVTFAYTVAQTDTTKHLFDIPYEALGITTSLGGQTAWHTHFNDGANAIMAFITSADNTNYILKVSCLDAWALKTSASTNSLQTTIEGPTFYIYPTRNGNAYTTMLDSACDKFYWKRTA